MITRSPVKPPKSLSAAPNARRIPTPLRSAVATTSILTSTTATGSTATPHEAMVASQLAHINDLVQKNRSLEQSIKNLNEDLAKSTADIRALNAERSSLEGDRTTWTHERQKWMDERKAWAEGCDAMQAFHRIQQYRVACALHDERVAVLKMQEAARGEQLKRLQRDYKIAMFQAREAELEAQIDEFEEHRNEAIDASTHHETAAQELNARCATLSDEVKSKMTEIQAANKRREQVEDDLRRLREAHADATATSTATSSKLARLTTERNSLDAQVTSLKRSLELAQDETTQLRTQLANWQNLKKGEDADAEDARKRKLELEQEIADAKRRITELEIRTKETDALDARVQKQKDRIEKFKKILEEWRSEVEEQTTAREAAETRLTDAQVQIASLEQKVVELQAQLSVASKSKLSNKKTSLTSPKPAQSDEEPGYSPSTSIPPTKVKDKFKKPPSTSKPSSTRPADAPTKPRPKPRLVKKPDPIPEPQDSDIEVLDSPPAAFAAPGRSGNTKGKQKAANDGGAESEIEIAELQKPKKAKPKDTKKDTEAEAKETRKAEAVKRKKTSSSDDNEEAQPKTKTKASLSKHSSLDPKKSKSKTAQATKELAGDAVAVETDVAPKKKKRKINLFGASQPSTFDWNALQTEQGLGIPTQLSPMKDTDAVPRRLGRASKG